MKIRQFTHGDLDGAACALIVQYLYPCDTLNVTYCQYGAKANSIDVNVTEFLNDVEEKKVGVDVLFITDICPSPDVCARIDAMKEMFGRVIVQDHHGTTAWAAKYDWMEHETKNKRCGAEMLFDWSGVSDSVVGGFVDAVDAYDRWQLDSPHRARGEDLNLLYKFLGPHSFAKEFSANPPFQADRTGWTCQLLPALRAQVDGIVRANIRDRGIHIDKQKRKYVFLPLSSSYASEIGNSALKEYPGIDYVVMAMPGINIITMRARKLGTDVSEIAKANGGGGHAEAAGFPFPLGELLWNAVAGCLDG